VLPQAASDHVAAHRRQAAKALLAVRSEWARMGEDLDASWARIGPRIVTLTAAAQLGSARDGLAYVDSALDGSAAPEAAIDPRGLAGVASDGRGLDQLLYSAVVRARSAKVDGLPQRLRMGGLWLDQLVKTQVADAGRDAAKVAMTVRPRVMWVRVVTPPCCQRCAVLSGRVYGYSHGFQRHPGCDCTMLPQTVADPGAAGRTVRPKDVTDLTVKQREALAGGANFNRTINDYQRKRGDYGGYLPPTRVDRVIDGAGQRAKAMDALAKLGIVVP
jgi:hypothetical protein